MERAAFEALIRSLEQRAKRDPRGYRMRVAAFAVLGYGVYRLVLLLAVALLAAMVALVAFKPSVWLIKIGWKLGIPVGFLIITLLQSLRVEIPIPQGIKLTRSAAPGLFAVLDELGQRLQVPPLSAVLLSDDYNASVVQLPRWGLFGKQSYLVLGMPLLQALSSEDVKAVLAHEFGHLSGNHGRFGAWIYFIRWCAPTSSYCSARAAIACSKSF